MHLGFFYICFLAYRKKTISHFYNVKPISFKNNAKLPCDFKSTKICMIQSHILVSVCLKYGAELCKFFGWIGSFALFLCAGHTNFWKETLKWLTSPLTLFKTWLAKFCCSPPPWHRREHASQELPNKLLKYSWGIKGLHDRPVYEVKLPLLQAV